MSVFVTGVDTNVGKTVVAAWVAMKMGWSYFKPIQTGYQVEGDSDYDYVSSLGVDAYPEHYRLIEPLSPYVAAYKERMNFDMKTLVSLPKNEALVVEGAGGVLVPITVDFDMIDLMKTLGIPVLLVATASLGTINHTRLTLKMLELRSINVLGVIMVGIDSDNKSAIENFARTRVFCQMPKFDFIDRVTLEGFEMNSDLHKILVATDMHD